LISKYHFMAFHFLAKPYQHYYFTNVQNLQTVPVFVVTTNTNAS
jgi:hypothetical protein